MTHDELLDKIEDIEYWQEQYAGKTFMKAIRAVVEMHKPKSTGIGFTDLLCEECSGLDANDYPCATIRAIEKVLV
jgi:hypothetical protein